GGFVKATISYTDYRKISGLSLSFKWQIVFGDEPDDVPILHEMVVTSIDMKRHAAHEYFYPKPELKYEKPGMALYFESLFR
ncbi:MAG: hypothetical protein JKY42_08080, partial [Flavobacteriales bacterium]|nr:hypothetical protein [Flavobacteriales bacterium]